MTRLEFGLNQKPNEEETPTKNEQEEQPQEFVADIDVIDAGTETVPNMEMTEKIVAPVKTMDWIFVKRVSLAQMILAVMSMICLLSTVLMGGVSWFKFATFFWSTFVVLAGYAGYKSYSTKNYYFVLTYLIMAAFQSLTNWFALVYSTYAAYHFEARELRYYKGYCLGVSYRDLALFLELAESLTMMGTVITGILGAKACVAGVGRLLTYQDEQIQKLA